MEQLNQREKELIAMIWELRMALMTVTEQGSWYTIGDASMFVINLRQDEVEIYDTLAGRALGCLDKHDPRRQQQQETGQP